MLTKSSHFVVLYLVIVYGKNQLEKYQFQRYIAMQRICFENERRMREVPYQLSASDSGLFSHGFDENFVNLYVIA